MLKCPKTKIVAGFYRQSTLNKQIVILSIFPYKAYAPKFVLTGPKEYGCALKLFALNQGINLKFSEWECRI